MAAITLDIGGNTRRLDRDIQKTVNRVYSINLKTKGDQPLGRITGKVNEFNKSLDASNARVIAFGASAGIIFGVERAFTALVSSTIEVQKSLQDINVILNVSAQNLQKFGGELFNIARNTGQSFQEVAKAATEFSRQGLGVEETLKRTNEALILSRLSGLDAAKSVESLTAAVNSFASQAVTATEVVNKFATVDAAFAVSSADLADAIARVGSSAAQSGVSLNELIAIVTSAQQTTARGGAVIGNSFKTIFTRLQREKVVDLLESLGISGTDASGQVKSTIQLLQDLGAVYDTLGSQQQAYVAEQVGGVFQINILKAALADLGKEYSIYSSALNVAAGATDQAIRRNEELNKTYSAQINALQENARQLAAAGGERLLGPSIDRLVGGTNTLLKGFSESDGQGVGAVLGKGILDGIGQFIAGPGLALIGGVLLKLFRDLAKFATGSVQQLLGLNTAATQQRDLQQSINSILAKNPQLLELALKGEQGLNQAANSLLASLQKQTVELQKQAQVAQQISKAFIAQAGVRVAGGVPVVPTGKTPKAKSGGFIPNFSVQSELKGIKKSGDYTSSQKRKAAGDIRTANFPGIGPTVFNGQETIAKSTQVAKALGYPKGTRPKNPAEKYSILTPKMSEDLSVAAQGFVPNFALDTVANLKSKASRSGGLLGNLYNVGDSRDKGIKDEYSRPSIKRVPLQKNVSQYTKVADAFIRDVRKRASADPNSVGSIFNNLRYKGTPISQFTDKIKPDTLLDPKKDLKNNINIKGALGEIDSQKRFGSGSRTAEKQGDLFGADFLVKKQGGSYLVESKVTQRKVSDNILIAKALQYEGQIKGGKYKDRTLDEIKLKNIILSYAPFKSAAAGFIPNFAKASKSETVSLGDISSNRSYSTKLLSAIIPQPSQSLLKFPATAQYKDKTYTTTGLPVSGPNPDVTKKLSQQNIPNLHKNIGKVILDQANVFGQSLGATKFMSSVSELPNLGGVNSAAGVAFEGGVVNALGQSIGSKNARVDFSSNRLNPKIRRIFNNAPGSYEAKNRPSSPLINDVFSKFLSRLRPGAAKLTTTGGIAQRSLRIAELTKQGLSRRERDKILRKEGLSAAAGFIPNFAAIQTPLQNAINNEIAAGASPNQVRVDKNSKLKTSLNPDGLGVWSKKYEGSLPEGIRMAEKAGINPKTKGMSKAGGYIPNFAIEDPDMQAASFGTAIGAITAQLTGLAFAFAFTGNQFKDSLKELTAANQQAGRVQREISAKQKREFFDEEKRLRGRVGAEQRANERAQQAQFAPGRAAKTGAFFRSNALGLSIAAPILGETIKNAVGQETAGARQFGAVASGAGQIGSFAATGALIAKGGGPIGLAIGALLTIPDIVNEFTTEMPELAAAAKKASQDLTKFSDVSQRLLTASSSLSDLTDQGASPEKLKKVQDDFAKALAELTPAERARIESSIRVGNLEEELAKITQERIDQEKLRSQAVSIRSIEERKGALGLFPAGFDPNTAQGRIDEETIRSVFKGFFTGKTPEETLENFNQAARSGVPQLEELIKTVGTLTKAQQIYSSGSLEQFRGILESIIPQGNTPDEQDFRSRFIKDLVELADEGDIKALQNVLKIPIKSLTRDRQQLEEGIESAKRAAESTALFNKVKEKYTGIIDNSISSLNKTIATFNALANALDKFQVNEKSFEREQGVGGLGLRKNIAETVLGPEAELTRRAALFEKIAQNEANRLDAIDQSNLAFRENFRENLKDVFTERAGEIATTKGQTATTIPEQARVANEVLRAVKLFESGAVDINKILEDSFKDGAIDPDQFKTALGAAFQAAEFKTPATNKILDSILSVAEEQNANLLGINQKASQENIRAAQEFKNEKILLDIRRSLQVFGGIEQFLTPPEEGIVKPLETLIKSATGQLQAQRDFEFAKRAGTGTSFGTEAQVQNNIALGQSALNFIKQLQDLSGGAFTPDPGSELYRRATAGLTQSFENNIKQLNDVLKDPEVDQAFKSQIQATLDAIGGLGSGREIAQLQIAKETGAAFQSTLEGALSRLQDPAIQQLQEAGLNDLANEVARSAQYTSDPIVNVLSVQRGIQVGIAQQLEKITTILSKQPKGGPTPSQTISPPIEDSITTNAKGLIPAFNKERAAISRGVGGAKAGDRPQFIPNLNGSPAFVNSGEQLVNNFMGSRQTAVLTRDMQKGMAKGFIPNFAQNEKVIENFNRYRYSSNPAVMGYMMAEGLGSLFSKSKSSKLNNINDFTSNLSDLAFKLGTKKNKKFASSAKGFIPNFAPAKIIDPNEFPKEEPFKTIRGKVVEDLTDTGKNYIVIRSETPLDGSFIGREIPFGSGKQTGKIISIDPYDRFSARVGDFTGEKVAPPFKDNPFYLALQPKQKENLTEKEIQERLKRYNEALQKASRYSTGDSRFGTPADAAEILKKLQRTFEFNSQNYSNLDNNSEYKAIKDTVEILRNKIRSTNPRAQERPQDPEFLKFLEEQSRGGGQPRVDFGPTGKTPGEIIAEAIVDSTMEPIAARATRATPEDLLTDATIRAAKVTSTIGKYGGLNLGSDNPFGQEGKKPKVTLKPKDPKNPTLRAYTENEKVTYLGKPTKVGTVINEAVGLNQNFLDDKKEMDSLQKGIEDAGGSESLLRKLKRFANFLEEQNAEAKKQGNEFLKVQTYQAPGPKSKQFLEDQNLDLRAFGYADKSRGFIQSEFVSAIKAGDKNKAVAKYIRERVSTLQALLSEGVVSGAITPQELSSFAGIPEDIAKNLVAEIIAIDKQLKEQKPFQPSTQKPVAPTIPKTPLPPQPLPGIQPAIQDTTPTITVRKPRKPPVVAPVAKPETPFRIIGGQGDRPATQIDASGAGVPVPKGGRVNYPGGISPETARAIVQELDANYNEAIKNQRNPQIAKAWAQTQQRYRLLYSQGKYEELDRFYQSLQKNYQRPIGQNPNKNQNQTNFATGFIPNFAQDYISNLANLESGLSGKEARLTNIPGIGLAMINEDQPDGKFPYKDHPEGKMAAIRNSLKMQRSMGVMNKGYIPNFAVTDQSFAQQEAAFNNNTSALTTLAGGIENLNSTLANFEANFANLNNVPGAQTAAGVQPNVTTTTSAPVNVVVNAQGGNDIAAAVGEAVQNAIPTIIDKVKLALGQKVPPTSNPKFGGGQRADGGFLL